MTPVLLSNTCQSVAPCPPHSRHSQGNRENFMLQHFGGNGGNENLNGKVLSIPLGIAGIIPAFPLASHPIPPKTKSHKPFLFLPLDPHSRYSRYYIPILYPWRKREREKRGMVTLKGIIWENKREWWEWNEKTEPKPLNSNHLTHSRCVGNANGTPKRG